MGCFQGEDVIAGVDAAAATASLPGSGQIAVSSRRCRSSKVRDNRLRSAAALRKLGCDMGLAAHRATGALGRASVWSLGKDLQSCSCRYIWGSHGRNGTYLGCRPSLTLPGSGSGWQNISSHATPTLRSNCFVLTLHRLQPTNFCSALPNTNSNLPACSQTEICFGTSGDTPFSKAGAPTAATLTIESEAYNTAPLRDTGRYQRHTEPKWAKARTSYT